MKKPDCVIAIIFNKYYRYLAYKTSKRQLPNNIFCIQLLLVYLMCYLPVMLSNTVARINNYYVSIYIVPQLY